MYDPMRLPMRTFVQRGLSLLLSVCILITLSQPVLALEIKAADAPAIWEGSVLNYVSDPLASTPRPEAEDLEISLQSTEEAQALSQELYANFLNADPELFRLTHEGILALNFYKPMTEEELVFVTEKALEITTDCVSASETIFAVAKYLALNICYDYDLSYSDYYSTNLSAYEVLTNEYTVCAGYAITFAVMMQLLGYPCVYVASPDHAWNMVYDGNRWMLVDTTWMTKSYKRNGVMEKSDTFLTDWYDFSFEKANNNHSHRIQSLPLGITKGVLSSFPKYSAAQDVVIPGNVTRIMGHFKGDFETLYLPKTITYIDSYCFDAATVDRICYEGTKSEYAKISIGLRNESLDNAPITYNAYQPAPVITNHPISQTLYLDTDSSATLSVAAEDSSEPLSYQWYVSSVYSNKGGTPIAGATESSYLISELQADSSLSYYAEIRGTETAVSAPAQIKVYARKPNIYARIGADAYYYWYDSIDEIHLDGIGSIEECLLDSCHFGGGSGTIIRIDAGITHIPESIANCSLVRNAGQYIVDEGNTIYTHDSAGALINQAESVLIHLPRDNETETYAIPEGIVRVADGGIDAYGFTSIHIPASLRVLSELPYTYRLSTITVDSENPVFYLDEPGVLIDSVAHRLIKVPEKEDLTSYVIDEDIVSIAPFAFCEAYNLQDIIFPASLKRIESSAFSQLRNLAGQLTLPEGLREIGTNAFLTCSSLTGTLKIPESVTSIGASAFAECTGITEVILPGTITNLGRGIFGNCTALETVTLGDGLPVLPEYMFRGCSSITELTLPKGMTTISSDSFRDMTGLSSLTVPITITDFSKYAFSDPTSVTLYGCAGTYAEEYATQMGMSFVDITKTATSITPAESTIYIPTGMTYSPVLLLFPADTTDAVTLTSSKSSVVSVFNSVHLRGERAGTATITATTTNSLSCSFTVHVRDLKVISIRKLPDRLQYNIGDTLDLTGMVVEAAFVGGGTATVTGYTVTGFRPNAEGVQTLTVTYGDVTTQFNVWVSSPQSGSLGTSLDWTLACGELSFSGQLPADSSIYIASMDSFGRMLDVGIIHSAEERVQHNANAVFVRLFLVNQAFVPLCKETTIDLY